MKHGSVTVEIHHQAGMAAANTVNAKQSGLVDFNTFQGSTFKHRRSPKFQIIEGSNRHRLGRRAIFKSQAY